MTHQQREDLEQTGQIVLETIPNQYGRPVVYTAIKLRLGRWFRVNLMCWSSKWFDLGACNCVTHDPYRVEEIPHMEVLRLLREG